MRRKMRQTVAIHMVKKAQQLLSQWENAWVLGGILLLFESVLCALIIWKRPYTKIDWDAYMQVHLNNERVDDAWIRVFMLNSCIICAGSRGPHAARAVELQHDAR